MHWIAPTNPFSSTFFSRFRVQAKRTFYTLQNHHNYFFSSKTRFRDFSTTIILYVITFFLFYNSFSVPGSDDPHFFFFFFFFLIATASGGVHAIVLSDYTWHHTRRHCHEPYRFFSLCHQFLLYFFVFPSLPLQLPEKPSRDPLFVSSAAS